MTRVVRQALSYRGRGIRLRQVYAVWHKPSQTVDREDAAGELLPFGVVDGDSYLRGYCSFSGSEGLGSVLEAAAEAISTAASLLRSR